MEQFVTHIAHLKPICGQEVEKFMHHVEECQKYSDENEKARLVNMSDAMVSTVKEYLDKLFDCQFTQVIPNALFEDGIYGKLTVMRNTGLVSRFETAPTTQWVGCQEIEIDGRRFDSFVHRTRGMHPISRIHKSDLIVKQAHQTDYIFPISSPVIDKNVKIRQMTIPHLDLDLLREAVEELFEYHLHCCGVRAYYRIVRKAAVESHHFNELREDLPQIISLKTQSDVDEYCDRLGLTDLDRALLTISVNERIIEL